MSTQPVEIIDDPVYDGCVWPVAKSCVTEEWNALEPEIQHWSLALASGTLHRLTGYRVGGCPITVRPCKRSCAEQYGTFASGTFVPNIDLTGSWVNACGCQRDCDCTTSCVVTLPGSTIEVTEVTVGATDITADTVLRGNRLIYTGTDNCPFPACQDMAKDPGEEGAFAVTLLDTYPVDGLGARAAGVLAMEFSKACTGGKCRLPRGTKSVSKQGVTIDVVIGTFPGGVTGIDEIDAYTALWRDEKSPTRPTTMWSPGRGVTHVS